ncbi:MAG: 30S ribosome-binding factor RbfA [Rhodospirillales bacterium]|jgi:ribosome-binding factor A|nr:30S ribosome-binding factor RbfA [Rhodospirillales bacterium]
MSRQGQKPAGQRQLRVGEELRHALAVVFERGHLRDPDLAGVSVTVSEVRISPDLRNATVFVMPLGGDDVDGVVEALKRAGPFLRGEIARSVKLRYVPRLSFQADATFGQASLIDNLLNDPVVARDLARDDDAEEEAPEENENG